MTSAKTWKSIAALALCFGISLMAFATTASADDARPLNPNSVNVEILGKGFLYTVNYDRALTEDIFAGIGFGTVGLNNPDGSSANVTADMFPVYLGYYFIREHGTPFLEVGASAITSNNVKNLVTNLGGMTFSSSQLLPFAGLGYEERTDYNFLFRVTGYAMCGQNVKPWFGATFGYAF
jgi:hypothetical protein